MKGLILKDLYMVWKYCRAIVFACVMFLVLSVFVEGSFFFTVYPVVIAGIIPYTILVYEEKFKWAAYCQTFPVTRGQVVSSKYLLSVICVAIAFIGTLLFTVLKVMTDGSDMISSVSMIVSTIPMALIGPAVMLPFIFKYDVEKARLMYYIVIGGVCGLSAFISFDNSVSLLKAGGVTVFAAIAIFIVSWLLSVRIYKNKEI